jgi:transposase
MNKTRSAAPRKQTKAASGSAGAKKKRRGGQAIAAPVLEGLSQITLQAAGIDVGAAENYVAVPASSVSEGEPTVRCFGVFTEEQDALVEWLVACRIQTVAMEATGVYWMSLFDKLEAAGMQVVLVDPHSVKTMPGRKSDVLDCQWLQQLHSYGLLRGAFRPESWTRRLRALTRQRANLVEGSAQQLHRMEKALVQMNVQLGLVVSDIDGETGLRIIQAILDGQHDPHQLVQLRDPRIKKSSVAEMEAALRGHYTAELLFILRQHLESWHFHRKQLEQLDQQILGVLERFPVVRPTPPPPTPPKPVPSSPKVYRLDKRIGRGKNAPTVDMVGQLQRICGVNLMAVAGLNVLSVLMLIGEIGVDMSRWPSAKAFCSWLGLCPGTKISGGKKLSRRTRRVVNRVSILLRVVAVAVGRSNTWLGRFHRRKKAHLGAPKAVTATARKLACLIYHMLKYQDAYVPMDENAYEAKAREQRIRQLRHQAKQLGFEMVEAQEVA